jgi:broad specificity phosphatase PhoE
MRGIFLREIILVRHGEADHLVESNKLTGGWTDTDLTHAGVSQAIRIGMRLSEELKGKQVKLYSSDLKRARKTAEIISDYIRHPIVYSEALREYNNGNNANQKVDLIKEFPRTEPLLDWVPYERAESYRMFYNRVALFMNNLIESQVTVIVTHAGTISKILNWWFEIDEEKLIKFDYSSSPCSVTKLVITDLNQKNIVTINDRSHLIIATDVPEAKFTFKL